MDNEHPEKELQAMLQVNESHLECWVSHQTEWSPSSVYSSLSFSLRLCLITLASMLKMISSAMFLA